MCWGPRRLLRAWSDSIPRALLGSAAAPPSRQPRPPCSGRTPQELVTEHLQKLPSLTKLKGWLHMGCTCYPSLPVGSLRMPGSGTPSQGCSHRHFNLFLFVFLFYFCYFGLLALNQKMCGTDRTSSLLPLPGPFSFVQLIRHARPVGG